MDLELSIVEVKDNLKKAEAGPLTLGTTVDTTHLESVGSRVSGRASWTRAGGRDRSTLAQASPFSCRHSPKLPPVPQTVPPSTLQRRSRTGLFRSWSQAKAQSSRKPR